MTSQKFREKARRFFKDWTTAEIKEGLVFRKKSPAGRRSDCEIRLLKLFNEEGIRFE
jgi:hypothetical protein